jgi:class 3 adenylate cyclase
VAVNTENLCILLTDIAGYTERSALLSREQMERLLSTHNQLLLRLVRAFKGRHVKSIGDALLLTFKSPTDAMLCAMAMQDRLHEYNLGVPEPEQIHIRIAASLGEVRVTKTDVFGDPVNLTSRIEAITPVDEVYLSEAVYLAMNKAEVPIKEIGSQELKGISSPVKIFSIPRFTSNRLVAEPIGVPGGKNGNGPSHHSSIQYPFGGAHVLAMSRSTSNWQAMNWQAMQQMRERHGLAGHAVLGVIIAALLWGAWSLLSPSKNKIEVSTAGEVEAESKSQDAVVASQEAGGKGGITVVLGSSSYAPPSDKAPLSAPQSGPKPLDQIADASPIPTTSPEKLAAMMSGLSSLVGKFTEGNSASNVPLGTGTVSVSSTSGTGNTTIAKNNPAPQQPRFSETGTANNPAQKNSGQSNGAEKIVAEPKPTPRPSFRSIRAAKEAYRQGRITKDRYREIAYRLEAELDSKIAQLKSSYRSGSLNKAQYKERVRALKLAYE